MTRTAESRSRRRKAFAAVALVGAGAIAWGAGRVARIERAARHLSAVGQDAKSLLESYGAGVQDGDVERILSLYESGYEGAVLGDWDVEVATNRDGVRVADWHPVDALPGELPAERLRRFLGGLGGLEMAKFKLDRVVSLGAEGTTVRGFLWLRGDRDTAHGEERYEMQGLVLVGLARAGRGEEWQIRDQQLVWGRTVSGPGRGFDDEAASRGVDFTAVRNPLFDTPEWSPDSFEIIRYGAAGVSAVDYDGDGWDDLFFADGAAARLYRSQGDGTFRDATEAAGLPTDLTGVNVGLFVDLDNDGDRDLFLGVFTGPNRLYRNEGEGRFTDVTEGAGLGGLMVTAASAADYDEDGLLDLYVGRYLDPRTELPDTLTYTRNGEGNSLLRNLGGLRFEDATEEADVREGGLTLGVAWADYDRDGDEDLYVANDFGRNALLRNEGDGRFSDVSAESGALDFGFGMSASWGDVDNDGDFDLYVSNVHSGQRWYSQAATLNQYLLTSLRQGTILEDFPLYREIHDFVGSDWHRFGDRMVKGNSLLLNDGAGRFAEVAETARANPFGWYWGSGMLDFDNDGRLDLYAGNGWITGETHDDL